MNSAVEPRRRVRVSLNALFSDGCENWSVTLREERRLRAIENWVLRKLFWPGREKVTRGLRHLRNKKLYALYSSPVREDELDRECGMYWGKIKCKHDVCEEAKRNDHFVNVTVDGSTVSKWISEYQMGWCGLDWSASGYRQVVGFCANGNEHWGLIKCGWFN